MTSHRHKMDVARVSRAFAERRTLKRTARPCLLLALSAFAFWLLTSAALAHVPRLTEGGASLETATRVEAPATSWVYYGAIGSPDEVWYYRLDLSSGERLYLQLLTPGKESFAPVLAVMGPELVPEGRVPAFVQIPAGASAVVRGGDLGEAEFEPFTPGAYYALFTVDTPAPADGTYYVAVFDEEGGTGPFGLVVGYEERYTISAWIRLPADLMSIYAWDGGWGLALAPVIGALVVAGALIAWRTRAGKRRRSLHGWLAVAAGAVCFSSSVAVLTQMFRAAGRSGFDPAMVVTAGFILAPAIIGALLISLGWRSESSPGVGRRLATLVLGLAALGLLTGYFVGPALAVLAALVPSFRRPTVGRRSAAA